MLAPGNGAVPPSGSTSAGVRLTGRAPAVAPVVEWKADQWGDPRPVASTNGSGRAADRKPPVRMMDLGESPGERSGDTAIVRDDPTNV